MLKYCLVILFLFSITPVHAELKRQLRIAEEEKTHLDKIVGIKVLGSPRTHQISFKELLAAHDYLYTIAPEIYILGAKKIVKLEVALVQRPEQAADLIEKALHEVNMKAEQEETIGKRKTFTPEQQQLIQQFQSLLNIHNRPLKLPGKE